MVSVDAMVEKAMSLENQLEDERIDNACYRRAIRESLELLEDGMLALKKGKVAVVEDHIERAISRLDRTLEK